MKKALFIFITLITVYNYSNTTTGYFKVSANVEMEAHKNKHNHELYGVKYTDFDLAKASPKLEAEIKFKKIGLTVGTNYEVKNITPFFDAAPFIIGDFNPVGELYLKYDLPKFMGVDSYAKATLRHNIVGVFDRIVYGGKVPKLVSTFNVDLETDINHKFKDYQVGFKTNTTLEALQTHIFITGLVLNKPFDATRIRSKHSITLGKEKLAMFNNVKAKLGIDHTYVGSNKFKNGYISLYGEYNPIKDLKLNFKTKALYNMEKGIEYTTIMNKNNTHYVDKNSNSIINDSNLNIEYSGIKDTVLTADVFTNYLHNITNETSGIISNYVNYGTIIGAKYVGIKNLHLEANAIIAGEHFEYKYDDIIKSNKAYIEVSALAKYDINLGKQYVITPFIDANVKVSGIKYDRVRRKYVSIPIIKLTPGIDFEYNYSEHVNLGANIKSEMFFGNKRDYNGNSKALSFNEAEITVGAHIGYKW